MVMIGVEVGEIERCGERMERDGRRDGKGGRWEEMVKKKRRKKRREIELEESK